MKRRRIEIEFVG